MKSVEWKIMDGHTVLSHTTLSLDESMPISASARKQILCELTEILTAVIAAPSITDHDILEALSRRLADVAELRREEAIWGAANERLRVRLDSLTPVLPGSPLLIDEAIAQLDALCFSLSVAKTASEKECAG